MSSAEQFPQKPIQTRESTEQTTDEFNQTLLQEIPKLYRRASFLTKRSEDADDLTQETLTKALEKREQFKPGTNLGAWLQTIMHNTFVSSKRLSSNKLAYKEDPEEIFNTIAVDGAQESTADLHKLLAFIDKADLTPNQRKVVTLKAMGHTNEEIGKTMNIARGTVRTHIERSRKTLNESEDKP